MLHAGSNSGVQCRCGADTPARAAIAVSLLVLPLSFAIARPGWVMPNAAQAVLLFGVGISGTLGVYLIARAYNAAEASAVVPYDFLRLPLTTAAAFALFAETPDIWTWLGALVIFASSYALVRIEARGHETGS